MKEVIEISAEKFNDLLSQQNCIILDVREKEEFLDYNSGGLNVPAHLLNNYYEQLKNYDSVIVVCSNGMRSSIISRVLNLKLKSTTVYHLSEGLDSLRN